MSESYEQLEFIPAQHVLVIDPVFGLRIAKATIRAVVVVLIDTTYVFGAKRFFALAKIPEGLVSELRAKGPRHDLLVSLVNHTNFFEIRKSISAKIIGPEERPSQRAVVYDMFVGHPIKSSLKGVWVPSHELFAAGALCAPAMPEPQYMPAGSIPDEGWQQ